MKNPTLIPTVVLTVLSLVSAIAVPAIAAPGITEFMASNRRTLEDEDIDEPDWIEIASDSGSANLEGYYLTNDKANLSQWMLPAVRVGSSDHLIVYASGKDRSDADGILHTNFRLPAGGGYLALVAPDGETIVTEFEYPEQATDISYGVQDGKRGFFAEPSPGAENSGLFAAELPAEAPVFNRESGLFTDPVTISIAEPESPGTSIRYVIDSEDEPTEDSAEYTEPIRIDETVTIRARIFEDGKLPGPIVSVTMVHVDDDELMDFSSDLPILVIKNLESRTFGSGRNFQTTYTLIFEKDSETGRASVSSAPAFHSRGGMHVRGQSSSGFPKKQYRWEIWDENGDDRNEEILGMPADADWIVHAPYSDKTLMRNVLVYDVARDLAGGMGGVRTRYAEVFFDTAKEAGSMKMSDYMGVYAIMERIERGEERVDIAKLNELTDSEDRISGGYIFKKDKPPHEKTFRTAKERQTLDFVDPPLPTNAQKDFLTDYVNAFEAAIHDDDLRGDPVEGYAKYINVESWIDNHLFVELFKEIDGYRISGYFVKDRGEKIRATPVWDYNLALGNANYLNGQNPRGWYYPQISKYPSPDAQYPWYPQLFKDTEFEKQYWDRYFELRQTIFDEATLMAKIDAFTEELKEAQERNFAKWRILGRQVWPNASGVSRRTTHQHEVDWMKDWLHRRIDWFDSQWIKPPVFSQAGGSVPSGYELKIDLAEGEKGNVFYTMDGGDPQPSTNGKVTIRTLVPEAAAVRVWVPDSDAAGGPDQWGSIEGPENLDGWKQGQGGVGFEKGTGPFIELATTNVQEDMLGVNATAYIRIEFEIASEAELEQASALSLRMRYDDGFVAYINGVEVARENAPEELAWNSKATKSHSDSKAILWEDYDASAGVPHLKLGKNILAIHGMNTSSGGSDALWNAELDGRFVALPTAGNILRYTEPIQLTSNAHIKARIRDGEDWGALTEAVFVVGATPASAENLIISELNYRPSDTTEEEAKAGFTSRRQFEYIVITNVGSTILDLTGVAFADGIEFTFDSEDPDNLVLGPGEHGVLAGNRAAFELRYGAQAAAGSYKILGEFSGNLANGGEAILLQDKAGVPIVQFTYDDTEPWPTAADGEGQVLSLNAPGADPSDPGSWSAQEPLGGIEPPVFGDTDGDLVPDAIEIAMGTDPQDRLSFAFPVAGTVEIEVEGELRAFSTFSYLVDTEIATDLPVEVSADLADWAAAEGKLLEHSRETAGGTRQIVTLRASVPLAETTWNFYRINLPTE